MRVVGAVGAGEEKKDPATTARTAEEEAELEEARKEAEEARKEKHRKMEVERENVRQVIRDKYNIKKKEEAPVLVPDDPSRAFCFSYTRGYIKLISLHP